MLLGWVGYVIRSSRFGLVWSDEGTGIELVGQLKTNPHEWHRFVTICTGAGFEIWESHHLKSLRPVLEWEQKQKFRNTRRGNTKPQIGILLENTMKCMIGTGKFRSKVKI